MYATRSTIIIKPMCAHKYICEKKKKKGATCVYESHCIHDYVTVLKNH